VSQRDAARRQKDAAVVSELDRPALLKVVESRTDSGLCHSEFFCEVFHSAGLMSSADPKQGPQAHHIGGGDEMFIMDS